MQSFVDVLITSFSPIQSYSSQSSLVHLDASLSYVTGYLPRWVGSDFLQKHSLKLLCFHSWAMCYGSISFSKKALKNICWSLGYNTLHLDDRHDECCCARGQIDMPSSIGRIRVATRALRTSSTFFWLVASVRLTLHRKFTSILCQCQECISNLAAEAGIRNVLWEWQWLAPTWWHRRKLLLGCACEVPTISCNSSGLVVLSYLWWHSILSWARLMSRTNLGTHGAFTSPCVSQWYRLYRWPA